MFNYMQSYGCGVMWFIEIIGVDGPQYFISLALKIKRWVAMSAWVKPQLRGVTGRPNLEASESSTGPETDSFRDQWAGKDPTTMSCWYVCSGRN
jgi:hypothetical protein